MTSKSKELIAAFVKYLVGYRGIKPSTASSYARSLAYLDAFTPLPKCTKETIAGYFEKLVREGKRQNTIRSYQAAVKAFYGWYSFEFGTPNPAEHLRSVREEKIFPNLFTREEFVQMVEACDASRSKAGLKKAAILCILADTGMRPGELIALKMEDITEDMDCWRVKIRGQLTGSTKTSVQREVPFAAEYWTGYWWQIQYKENRRPTDPVFLRDALRGGFGEGPMSQSALRALVSRLKDKAGITHRISPYSFRHFFATYSYINGMPLLQIKMLMGHRSTSTTERYIGISNSITKRTMQYNALMGVAAPDQAFKKLVRINKQAMRALKDGKVQKTT